MGMVMMPKKGIPTDGAMGGSMRSTSATKSNADVKLEAVYSSPNTRLAPPIDRARQPVWVLNSRHIKRVSIIRWQGICAGAPPMLLVVRNPRAAERDAP